MSLKHITFTGIDAKTDIQALKEIQRKFPIVEFGVLTSYHWYENGNRYLDPQIINGLRGNGLNLALHICGSAAHDASRGFWGKIIELTKDNLDIFKRCQVNIANRKDNYPYCWMASYPYQEVIIQQRNILELDIFDCTVDLWRVPTAFSVLLDASGGRGIDTPIEILNGDYKVGYAGGLNPDNVGEKLSYLMENVNGDFWIDMESGVRTNDYFDLEKAVKVLEICESIIKKEVRNEFEI